MTLDWQQVQEFAPELGVALDVLLALGGGVARHTEQE